MPAVLFCATNGAVEEPFGPEAAAVLAAGGRVGLVDHGALLRGDPGAAVRAVPPGLGPAWYRGWMLPEDRYDRLAAALPDGLLVPPDRHRRAHQLPGWYAAFARLTPATVWLPSVPRVVPAPERLAELVAPLGGGPGIVKDYVKSRKQDWHEACFVPDLPDTADLHRVVSRFVELQHAGLTGGIVVRAFERFTGGEARVWWLDGTPVLTAAHPDTPHRLPRPDLNRIGPAVAALGCRFVTTDLALRADGAWRLVELGDGQVGGLPAGLDPGPLLTALVHAG